MPPPNRPPRVPRTIALPPPFEEGQTYFHGEREFRVIKDPAANALAWREVNTGPASVVDHNGLAVQPLEG